MADGQSHLVKVCQTELVEVGTEINELKPGFDKLLMTCKLKRLCSEY